MSEPYHESVLPIPQVVDLVNKAGELVAIKRTDLSEEDVDTVLWHLGCARTALDGDVSDWAHGIPPR
jgi:hypothetical protein